MTKEEENLLIRKVLAGDANAFEPLVREQQNHVYALCFRMLGSEQDAADASQEAFIKAYTSLKDFRGDSRFSVWLYRLTSNICIDFLRRNKRRPTVPISQENEDGETMEMTLPDEGPTPEELAEKKETREEVRAALEALPEDYRQILTLRELGELSYEEIAQKLDLETGTVKSRLNRARKKLCEALTNKGNFSVTVSSQIKKEG